MSMRLHMLSLVMLTLVLPTRGRTDVRRAERDARHRPAMTNVPVECASTLDAPVTLDRHCCFHFLNLRLTTIGFAMLCSCSVSYIQSLAYAAGSCLVLSSEIYNTSGALHAESRALESSPALPHACTRSQLAAL